MDVAAPFRLDGKVAVVTGASYGLGVLFAEVLASAGADLVITARSEDKLADTKKMVESLDRRCVAVAGDVTSFADCERVAQASVDQLGGLDILVNNAGIAAMAPIDRFSLAEFARTFAINVRAIFVDGDLLPLLEQVHALGALEKVEADLVLFGQASSDGDGAVLWAAVADRLRRPVISQVASLDVADGTITGKRQTEHGYDVISAPLPAVVAVSDAINEPRYPSLKGIMGAKTKPQETLSLSDLGVVADSAGEAGAKTVVLELGPPEQVLVNPERPETKRFLRRLLEAGRV